MRTISGDRTPLEIVGGGFRARDRYDFRGSREVAREQAGHLHYGEQLHRRDPARRSTTEQVPRIIVATYFLVSQGSIGAQSQFGQCSLNRPAEILSPSSIAKPPIKRCRYESGGQKNQGEWVKVPTQQEREVTFRWRPGVLAAALPLNQCPRNVS
jgi:hypothetical protein